MILPRILVTGSSGFIGKALVPALAARGHLVRAAARGPAQAAAHVEPVVQPDITRPVALGPLVAGMDVVVHLAGIAHRKADAGDEIDRANRVATADLAMACKAAGVQRLVFMSSIGAQTGSAADHVVTEADAPQPVTAYDRAKLAAEEAVRTAGVPYTILRPVIVYGPHPKANVALLAKLASLPVPLPFGAFRNRRSLLARDNLIAAIMACLGSEATRDQTFVVSDPAPISLAEMLAAMRGAAGRAPGLIPVPPALFKALCTLTGRTMLWDRIGRDLVVDPRKLIEAGWRPVTNTPEGLAAMVQASSRA